MKRKAKGPQMTRAWLENAIRSYEPARADVTVEQPLFPTHAIEIAKAWARRMRVKRSVQS